MTIIGFNLRELKKENRFKFQEKIFKNGLKVGYSYPAITLVQTGISLWDYQIILIGHTCFIFKNQSSKLNHQTGYMAANAQTSINLKGE